jgi:hypothetical protein
VEHGEDAFHGEAEVEMGDLGGNSERRRDGFLVVLVTVWGRLKRLGDLVQTALVGHLLGEDVEELPSEDFPHEGGGGGAEVGLVEMAAGQPMEETFLEEVLEIEIGRASCRERV